MLVREISSCSCLTVLPGTAWVLLSKKYILFPGTLYSRKYNLKRSPRWFFCCNFLSGSSWGFFSYWIRGHCWMAPKTRKASRSWKFSINWLPGTPSILHFRSIHGHAFIYMHNFEICETTKDRSSEPRVELGAEQKMDGPVQRSEKWLVRGWVKFVPALP